MSVATSVEAYQFAEWFLKHSATKPNQNAAQQDELSLEKAERHLNVDGPSRKITDIDYEKWEKFSNEISLEEKVEETNEVNPEMYKQAMSGCAHDHSKERQIYEKPTIEKLEAADRFRVEGNKTYGEQNYGLASVLYRKALLQFDYTFPDNKEEQEMFDKIKLSTHLNFAVSKLKLKDYDETQIQCKQALKIDPQNVKALYRSGLASLYCQHFDDAEKMLTAAISFDPDNAAIKNSINEIKKKKAQYKRQEKQLFKTMMGDIK